MVVMYKAMFMLYPLCFYLACMHTPSHIMLCAYHISSSAGFDLLDLPQSRFLQQIPATFSSFLVTSIAMELLLDTQGSQIQDFARKAERVSSITMSCLILFISTFT